jgi:hypothetical protein
MQQLSTTTSNNLTKNVPILIQPEDWMQPGIGSEGHVALVPILIQPEDWMQRDFSHNNIISAKFQSSSSPKTGCNSDRVKPADTNKSNDDHRDPIIPYLHRQIDITQKIAQSLMDKAIANLPGK